VLEERSSGKRKRANDGECLDKGSRDEVLELLDTL
jgi:hypothetical protein